MELLIDPEARDYYGLHKLMTICGMIGVKYLHKIVSPAGLGLRGTTDEGVFVETPGVLWQLSFDERAKKKTTALARICRNVGARLVCVSYPGESVEYNHEDDE